MNKYKQHELHPEGSESHQKDHHHYQSKEDEIADILRKQAESMKSDIAAFQRLAQHFYTPKKDKESEEEIGYKTQKNEDQEILYTLIKYENKDMLVELGLGNFDSEMFTRRDIQEYKSFSHSPLPLFVVSMLADEDLKTSSPKFFLSNNAVIISPKGGETIAPPSGTELQKKSIDYTNIHIMHYPEAFNTLQTALLNRVFTSGDNIKKVIEKISNLQKGSEEEFNKRMRGNQKYYTESEKMFFQILKDMSDEKTDMYTILKSFVIPQ